MKTHRIEKRTRTAALVTGIALAAMLVAAAPALALPGVIYDEPVKTIPSVEELLAIDGIFSGGLADLIPGLDGGDEGDGGAIPDGGADERPCQRPDHFLAKLGQSTRVAGAVANGCGRRAADARAKSA